MIDLGWKAVVVLLLLPFDFNIIEVYNIATGRSRAAAVELGASWTAQTGVYRVSDWYDGLTERYFIFYSFIFAFLAGSSALDWLSLHHQ